MSHRAFRGFRQFSLEIQMEIAEAAESLYEHFSDFSDFLNYLEEKRISSYLAYSWPILAYSWQPVFTYISLAPMAMNLFFFFLFDFFLLLFFIFFSLISFIHSFFPVAVSPFSVFFS